LVPAIRAEPSWPSGTRPETTLLDGEAARARRWGMTIGAASKTHLPAHA
jgi:hypothetical protein